MSKILCTEITVGKPLKFEHRIKINDLVVLLKEQRRFKTTFMKMFPDENENEKVRFAFVLQKDVSTNAFSLWVEESNGGKAYRRSSFAGKVEVDIDGVSMIGTFGNVQKNEYVKFPSAPAGLFVRSEIDDIPPLGPFPYTVDGDKKVFVEVKWTIYQQQPISVVQQEEKIPESLMSQETLSVVGAAIMKDVSTSDLSIHCDGKIFKAHKAFLCARSPVFRAMMQGNMVEARQSKVVVTDVDYRTFAAVLHYVYTGELKEGQDLNNMIYAAEKYDLPGLRGLLFLKMKSEDIQEEFIPDLLIIADKYQAGPLKKLALEKIRTNRKILEEKEFQKKLANSPSILFDLLKEL